MYNFIIENKSVYPPRKDGGQFIKYPWDKMKAGDYFIVNGYSHKASNRMSTVGNNWCKRNNEKLKVVVRKENNDLRVFFVENNTTP